MPRGGGPPYDNYIMIRSNKLESEDIHVLYLNGSDVRSIKAPLYFNSAALHDGYVIRGGRDKLLRIWDIASGRCLRELKGHASHIISADVHDGVIASCDLTGKVILWSFKAALETGTEAKLLSCSNDEKLYAQDSDFGVKVGPDFLATCSLGQKSRTVTVEVMDYPSFAKE